MDFLKSLIGTKTFGLAMAIILGAGEEYARGNATPTHVVLAVTCSLALIFMRHALAKIQTILGSKALAVEEGAITLADSILESDIVQAKLKAHGVDPDLVRKALDAAEAEIKAQAQPQAPAPVVATTATQDTTVIPPVVVDTTKV